MDQEFLQVENVSKFYAGVRALDGISFSLKKGEIHAICGENGAGKSTLIKILTGAIQPTGGSFAFDGKRFDRMTPRQAMEAGIRAIYQEFTLVPYLTVANNLFYGHEKKSGLFLDEKEMNDRTQALCEEMGVQINPKAKVASLGIAEQQIVEILKAISQSAKLFIMDEPTAPLTVKETAIFFNIIKKLKADGATIIFISHRLEEVFDICDRVTVFCDGKHVVTKNTNEIDRRQLISYMVGREIGEDFPQADAEIGDVVLSAKNITNDRLHDVSFSLRRGEILGFGGLIGAGRTELMRVIFGADPYSGQMLLNGKPYAPKSPKEALKSGVGLIPEDRKGQGLIMGLSIRENSTMPQLGKMTRFGLIRTGEQKEQSGRYLKSLRIKAPSDMQLVKNLSGGNQQKVVLAKMMMMNCDVLIFDEPTRGIDVGAKQEIYLLMREIARSGKSIIMVSSEMPELLGMSDRIIVISNGYHVADLAKNEFSQQTILEYASSKLGSEELGHVVKE